MLTTEELLAVIIRTECKHGIKFIDDSGSGLAAYSSPSFDFEQLLLEESKTLCPASKMDIEEQGSADILVPSFVNVGSGGAVEVLLRECRRHLALELAVA